MIFFYSLERYEGLQTTVFNYRFIGDRILGHWRKFHFNFPSSNKIDTIRQFFNDLSDINKKCHRF